MSPMETSAPPKLFSISISNLFTNQLLAKKPFEPHKISEAVKTNIIDNNKIKIKLKVFFI